jgi:hypothetical protein
LGRSDFMRVPLPAARMIALGADGCCVVMRVSRDRTGGNGTGGEAPGAERRTKLVDQDSNLD